MGSARARTSTPQGPEIFDCGGADRTVPISRPTTRPAATPETGDARQVEMSQPPARHLPSIFATWRPCEAELYCCWRDAQGKFAVCSENGTKGLKRLITQAKRTDYALKNSSSLFWIWNMLLPYRDERLPTRLLYGSRSGVYFV